jgi:RND family efflux transporter MFP subunit
LDSKLREVPKPDLSALRIDREDDVSPKTGLRVVLLGTALVVIVGILLIGYRLWASATVPEVEVARATVESGSAGLEVLTATGYVVAHRKAAVSPKISGRLEYLGVDTGSYVKSGEIIARLEHRDLDAQLADARGALSNWQATQSQSEAELEQARATLAQSQANRQKSKLDLERQSRLLKDGVVSRADFDNATAQAEVDEANVRASQALIRAGQFKVESAAAQIASAQARIGIMQAQIEYANIRAPFDGIVISKDAEVGETVAPAIFGGSSTRGSVVTIVDPDTLEVEADISESYIGKITMGLPAEVTLDALGAEKLPAATYKIVPTADRQKSTVKVKVRFDKVDTRILPDMSAKITFIQKDPQAASHQASRVTVPKAAIQQREGKTTVLVLTGDRLQSQVVTIGSEFGDRVEIKQGLAGGETLVLKGGENLSDGTRVKVKTGS